MTQVDPKQLKPGTLGQVLTTLAGLVAGWANVPGAILSWGGVPVPVSPTHLVPWGIATVAPLGAVITLSTQIIMPRAGTLKNMYVERVGGTTTTYDVYLNGVLTTLSVVLTIGNATGSDLVNTVAVAAGDKVALRATCGLGAAPSSSLVSLELG